MWPKAHGWRPPFRDRHDAGRQLATALTATAWSGDLVLGLPRGGVVVAARVAEALGVPLDVVVARKLRCPGQPELAMGAVAVWATFSATVRNEQILGRGVNATDFDTARSAELDEARARADRWSTSPDVVGRTVAIVDDGLATGATMRAALDVLRQAGAGRLVVAVPVAAANEARRIEALADTVVCVLRPDRFGSVGAFYGDFAEVADGEVERELAAARG